MSIKEYLSRFIILNKEIDSAVAEYEMWRSKAEHITSTISNGGGGKSATAKFENPVDKMLALNSTINNKIDTLIKYRREISNVIEHVEDDTYRVLLRYRYISGYTFEQIAVKLCKSWRWTISLHGRALQEAAEVWKR